MYKNNSDQKKKLKKKQNKKKQWTNYHVYNLQHVGAINMICIYIKGVVLGFFFVNSIWQCDFECIHIIINILMCSRFSNQFCLYINITDVPIQDSSWKSYLI